MTCESYVGKITLKTKTEKEDKKEVFHYSLPLLDWLLNQKSLISGPTNERL